MIHICYVLYDGKGRYSKFVGTSMTSILENANPMPPPLDICFHILHDKTLSSENRDKLVYVVGSYKQQIKFYNVEEICTEKIAEIKKIVQPLLDSESRISTFYKFLIADAVGDEFEKIIYIDADTIVNLDISELWQIDLGDKIFGAVTEPSNGTNSQAFFELCRRGIVADDDYVNGGLFLINLKVFREQQYKIFEGLKFEAENPDIIYYDQDVFNYCYSKDYLKLPNKFNYFACWNAPTPGEKIGKKIYHYLAATLQLNQTDKFSRLWARYFAKTPWFNEDVIAHFYEGVQQVQQEGKNFAIQITKIMSGKERGFFCSPENFNFVKNIFAISDDEEIISEESIENLIQSMKRSQGKKIFFILVGNFGETANKLTAEGFTFGKDFLNCLEFLSERQGIFFNTHSLVQLL